MLVTLAIATLVAGLAFPAVERVFARQQFSAGALAIDLALAQARARAIGQRETVRVSLSRDGRTLLADGEAPLTLAESLTVGWPPRGLAFFADGTSTGGSIAVAGGGRRGRIAVDPYTARIAIIA